MTRTTNARIAGFTFLFYIAAGLSSMILFGRATSGDGIAAKLAGIAQHATDVRVVVLLNPNPTADQAEGARRAAAFCPAMAIQIEE